jgi:cephalosporin-C deacetylase-like acetyl esterase
MNNIREYLYTEACKITEASGNRFKSGNEIISHRNELKKQFFEMMGISDLLNSNERRSVNAEVVATTEQEKFVIERLWYESMPRLYVTANLYIPKSISTSAPAVLYLCGHSANQKVAFQSHCRKWAELGFVVLIVETIQLGEISGYHHGCYTKGWFHWYSRGYTPAGVELFNAIRAIDLLVSRKEVDPDRIGVTGISGGGAGTWWVAAGDERVKVSAPVCATGTLKSHISERTLDGHCDCMFFINYFRWDLADLGYLIAPRPLLIASADRDGLYSIESIRECYRKLKTIYELLGVPDNVKLVETPGKHSYHPVSSKAIFAWFLKHLCDRDVSPDQMDDVNEKDGLPDQALRVFTDTLPPDERTAVIHDSFVPIARRPEIVSIEDLQRKRKKIVNELYRTTFAHFPSVPCPLNPHILYESKYKGYSEKLFSFVPENGWVLHGTITIPDEIEEKPSPALVYLRHPRMPRNQADEIITDLRRDIVRVQIEVRGVWESSWGDDIAWHVRRACAVLGRTVASMRVYDVLRALEVIRSFPEINGTLALAGQGEMAVIALYSALLDGNIKGLLLIEPPGTQNAPSNPDGSGDAIEMLGVLRYTDLPVTSALLYPAELAFRFGRTYEYEWTEEVYAKLGLPGRISHVRKLSDWRCTWSET